MSLFLQELQSIITDLKLKNCPFLLTGDFNIHFDVKDSTYDKVVSILDQYDLRQYVNSATHILDWVISPLDQTLFDQVFVDDKAISDHCVNFMFTYPKATECQEKYYF